MHSNKILLFVIWQAREFLSKLGDLKQTQIFAKIENIEVRNFKSFRTVLQIKVVVQDCWCVCFLILTASFVCKL